ncbi:MAG: hypothetical protein ACK4WH_14025 [Phycisphaerales bacterium]
MPPLPKIRTHALAELARQLRFESAGAARRQLERTEALALEVLAECGSAGAGQRAYPVGYVTFRITGLRTAGDAEGSSLAADVLLADLGALIERLSSSAGVTVRELEDDTAGPWMTIEEVAARWKVGRRTVDRARRAGLIARRARDVMAGAGAALFDRIRISARAVEAYEAARGRSAPAKATARRDRLTAGERTRIIATASRCRARFGWSLSACATRIARKSGRSKATISRLLRRHDEETGQGTFGTRPVLREARRARLARSAARGASVARLAARLGRGRATGYRLVAADRLAFLRGLDLHGPVGAMFEREDAEEVLLAPGPVRAGLGAGAPATVGATIELAEAMGAPEAEAERARAVAAALLGYKVRRWLAELPGRRGVGMRLIREAEARLLWSSRLRAELVRSQLPVALRSARERLAGRDPRTLPSRGVSGGPAFVRAMISGVIGAVDRYDPFRGGRLAAATTIGVTRAIGEWAVAAGIGGASGTGRAQNRCDHAPVEDWTRAIDPWQSRLEPPEGAAAWAREASSAEGEQERARRVVAMLYGLDGGPPRAPVAVAAAIGTSPARVVAIERRTIARFEAAGQRGRT